MMRYPISTGSTIEQEGLSVGAFLTDCTVRSDPRALVTWTLAEQNDRARAVFHTNIEVTGQPSELPRSAAYRLACFLILGHLKEPGLKEACDALVDMHHYQIESERLQVLSMPVPKTTLRKVAHRRTFERPPLTIAD
jgi:hypothetical protein